MLNFILKKFSPSFKIGKNLFPKTASRFQPIPIWSMKVTPWTKSKIFEKKSSTNFEIIEGKRLTIIIAYRNRPEHLNLIIPALVKKLKNDNINGKILVVEQSGDGLFNRGKLMNVGAAHSWEDSDYFCFHDVDIIPELANYNYPSLPLRLVTKLSYSHRGTLNLSGPCLGGVVSIPKDQFEIINGFSNNYWGWGQEDDDLLMRCLFSGFMPYEDLDSIYADLDTPTRELEIKKIVAKRGSNRTLKSKMWRGLVDFNKEGINTLKYNIVGIENNITHSKITVQI